MKDALFPSEDRRKFRDRRIPPSLLPILAKTKYRVISESYCVVETDAESGRKLKKVLNKKKLDFFNLTLDQTRASAVLPHAIWKEIRDELPESQSDAGYRILAIEGEANWITPGYLAVISRVLGEAGVGAGMIAGYQGLFLVVKAKQLKDVRVFLNLLSDQAKGRLKADPSGSGR